MQVITRYFPELTKEQIFLFEEMVPLYIEWNRKINVISRKDVENLAVHHILHSLSIAKIISFSPNTNVLDVGTGGGFPGIPLAVLFPEVHFHLIDAIAKKITVVSEISQSLGLKNVSAQQIRVEQVKETFDFVVSRAVTRFDSFRQLVGKNIHHQQKNKLPNGIIYLKGGEFDDEIEQVKHKITLTQISHFFEEPFFETKKIIHLPV